LKHIEPLLTLLKQNRKNISPKWIFLSAPILSKVL
jgi:hypothetical protein